jgi:hypothetical protein
MAESSKEGYGFLPMKTMMMINVAKLCYACVKESINHYKNRFGIT